MKITSAAMAKPPATIKTAASAPPASDKVVAFMKSLGFLQVKPSTIEFYGYKNTFLKTHGPIEIAVSTDYGEIYVEARLARSVEEALDKIHLLGWYTEASSHDEARQGKTIKGWAKENLIQLKAAALVANPITAAGPIHMDAVKATIASLVDLERRLGSLV